MLYNNAKAFIAAAIVMAAAAVCAGAAQTQVHEAASVEGLILGLSRLGLGSVSGLEEKRQFLSTVQVEKLKIQRKMLEGVYSDAYDYYQKGDCIRAKELAGKIVTIDPDYTDARVLEQVCSQLQGRPGGIFSARHDLLESRFEAALALYNDGKLEEAAAGFEEVIKLAPDNTKAKTFLKKTRAELDEDYIKRGGEAFSKGNLRAALGFWYNALLINKDEPTLSAKIAWAETELRREQANNNFQRAMELYDKGKLTEAYTALRTVLDYEPGDSRAKKLVEGVRSGIASSHIGDGKKYYASRQYAQAIGSWSKAKEWGYDSKYVNQLIDRAREQMRREDEYRKNIAEKAKREAEEAAERERQEAEEAAKAEMGSQLGDNAGVEKSGSQLPAGISEESKRSSAQHFQNGLKAFQDGDYDKARNEWTLAKQINSGNIDADAGLKRIDQMFGGGQ